MGIRKFALSLFQHQTLYWLRIDLHFVRQRLVHALRRIDPQKIKTSAMYLNVGCGTHGLKSEAWYNVDGFPAEVIDLVCDARRPLPFPARRFRGIYSEHFLEHLTPDQARCFLAECLRVLLPGGVLRLSVPDGELYLRKYITDRAWMLERRGGRFHTPMAVVNEVFRQGFEHQYCYDFETLSLALSEAGFVDIKRVGFGQGSMAELQIDQASRQFESLYVEGTRPVKDQPYCSHSPIGM